MPSLILAVIAFATAMARINHGLVDSPLPAGPGLTLDEPINVSHGTYLFEALLDHGPLLWTPARARAVFGAEEYLPDYPPLGRLWLGAAHVVGAPLIAGSEESALNIPAARLGSCFALALTVLMLTEFVRRRYGTGTAILAGVLLVLMPRVIGHARLASLETVTTLAWLAALVPIAAWWTGEKPPTYKQALVSGLLFGLLLLTKIQGILFPPIVVGWSLWQFRRTAVLPLTAWGLTGLAVFCGGWPWLWLDPVNNVIDYFASASERPTLHVWYFGHRYADKLVPWHYPIVMTLITVPLFVLIPAGLRIRNRNFDRVEQLLCLSVLWPLIVFALPGTPVYDGTRLFLMIMPAVAFVAARGCGQLVETMKSPASNPQDQRRSANALRGLLGLCLLLPVEVCVYDSFCLNSYNLLVLGPRSATETFGMEAGYWADGLNGEFWQQVPENATVMVAPVSHQFQLSDWEQFVPVVQQRNIRLVPFEYATEPRGLLLLIHRLADLRPSLRTVPAGAGEVAEVTYRGNVLARLIDTKHATWTEVADWPP